MLRARYAAQLRYTSDTQKLSISTFTPKGSMKMKWCISFSFAIWCLVVPAVAIGQDVDDLGAPSLGIYYVEAASVCDAM